MITALFPKKKIWYCMQLWVVVTPVLLAVSYFKVTCSSLHLKNFRLSEDQWFPIKKTDGGLQILAVSYLEWYNCTKFYIFKNELFHLGLIVSNWQFWERYPIKLVNADQRGCHKFKRNHFEAAFTWRLNVIMRNLWLTTCTVFTVLLISNPRARIWATKNECMNKLRDN